MPEILVEILGYSAMIVVGAGFLFSDISKIRVVNVIGCLMFICYALCKNDIPVMCVNSLIICVHGWKSYVEKRDRECK